MRVDAPRPFLHAHWESLLLLNFECPRALLDPLVPRGTELDDWHGSHLVSLVGFMFRDTRVLGVAVPFHHTFEEVNLRFYVRRVADGGVRRAVVFIRELVPRRAIAVAARTLYNEPYLAVPMSHAISLSPGSGGVVRYDWTAGHGRFTLEGAASGPATPLEPGSEAWYMTEHYYGYTRQRDGGTLQYRVEHEPWLVWDAEAARFDGPAERLYGGDFAGVLTRPPHSAHIAVGGPVIVYAGQRIRS